MKNKTITIVKKELARFFGDKRLVVTTIILPGLMIFLLYTFMGSAMSSLFVTSDDYVPKAYVENIPSILQNNETIGLDMSETEPLTSEQISSKLRDKEINLYVIFPENFDNALQTYEHGVTEIMEISVFYDSTNNDSTTAFGRLTGMLNSYETSLANVYNINSGSLIYDVATKEDTTGMLFSMMVPMLLIVFLFSGCMAVAPESIAGEKERGTIAALLVTPLKRGELAMGKIVALSIIALLSGLSSFLGTMLSLPKLMGAGSEIVDINANVYGVSDYITLLAVILSTVFLMIALISIISAFAKSVKEAATLVMPLMILVMLVGVTSMYGTGVPSLPALYLIPIYNSVQCMNGVFSFSGSMINTLITVAVNIVYTCGMVFVLKKMFESEKIMFNKS